MLLLILARVSNGFGPIIQRLILPLLLPEVVIQNVAEVISFRSLRLCLVFWSEIINSDYFDVPFLAISDLHRRIRQFKRVSLFGDLDMVEFVES